MLIVPHVFLRKQECVFECDMTDANFLALEMSAKEKNRGKMRTLLFPFIERH